MIRPSFDVRFRERQELPGIRVAGSADLAFVERGCLVSGCPRSFSVAGIVVPAFVSRRRSLPAPPPTAVRLPAEIRLEFLGGARVCRRAERGIIRSAGYSAVTRISVRRPRVVPPRWLRAATITGVCLLVPPRGRGHRVVRNHGADRRRGSRTPVAVHRNPRFAPARFAPARSARSTPWQPAQHASRDTERTGRTRLRDGGSAVHLCRDRPSRVLPLTAGREDTKPLTPRGRRGAQKELANGGTNIKRVRRHPQGSTWLS